MNRLLTHWTRSAVLAVTAGVALAFSAGLSAAQAQQNTNGGVLVHPAFESLAVEVNKGTLIRLDRPATEVFLANPDIADIQVKSPRLIYLFGKERGETSFFALDGEDNIIFSSTVEVTQSLTNLRSALKDLLPDAVVEAGLSGSIIILKGYVSSPEESAAAQDIAERIAGGNVVNRITVLQPTQVNLRVRFAEVSRSVLKELGISIESVFTNGNSITSIGTGRDVFNVVEGANGLPTRNFIRSPTANSLIGSVVTGGLDLNYAIDALNNEGFLTVLAEPNLTALSGQQADFLAGGEFPVPIPSRDGLGIEYREFGVRLEFTPTVLSSGRINMVVAPEVSDLSNAGAIQLNGFSIPSVSTRRARTTVELGSGQSFAIAGLLQNRVTQDADKFPGLGDIPILGALFRSDRFRREETELLIVVTPYLVRPVSTAKLSLPTDGFVAPNDAQRFLGGRRWTATDALAPTAAGSARGPAVNRRAGFRIDD